MDLEMNTNVLIHNYPVLMQYSMDIIHPLSIVRFLNSVSTCISERVISHLEGMCSDCK